MRGLRGNSLKIGRNPRHRSAKDSSDTENLLFPERFRHSEPPISAIAVAPANKTLYLVKRKTVRARREGFRRLESEVMLIELSHYAVYACGRNEFP